MPVKDKDAYNAYMKEYMLKRYHEKRNAKIAELGGVCVHCGSDQNLEFDHIDPSTKEFTIAIGWSSTQLDAEVAKCQLLCKSCHLTKTKENKEHGKILKHGTEWMYSKHKCRCESCKEAFRSAKRKRYHARKSK